MSTKPNRNSFTGKDLYKSPAVKLPPIDEINQIDKELGLKSSQEEIQYIYEHLKDVIQTYGRVNEISEPSLPVKYPRTPGYKVDDDDSWYWKCEIKGAETGKLVGKTVTIKDSVAVAGVPMMNGSKLLEGYTPEFDATIVTRILDEGGTIIGKAVCEDMCFTGQSWTASTGPVRNPFNNKLMAGGSSSGSASLLARKETDMAIGCDQGCSIRLPASWCGVVGLKPTFGLVPYTGIASIETTFDHAGPMARTVKECALLLQIISGYDDGRDPRQIPDIQIPPYSELIDAGINGMTIGLVREGFDCKEMDKDVACMVRDAAFRLTSVGAIVKDVSVPMHDDGVAIFTPISIEGSYNCMVTGNGSGFHWKGHYSTSLQEALTRGLNLRPYDMPYPLKVTCIIAEYIKRNYQNKFYAKGQNLTQRLTKAYDEALETSDVLIMPTVPVKPGPLPTDKDDFKDVFRRYSAISRNTAPFNITGHPALSMNTGFSDGLPVGMMIVGRRYDELTVLKVAQAFESLRDNE